MREHPLDLVSRKAERQEILVEWRFRRSGRGAGVVRQHRRNAMAKRGRPTVEIELSADERAKLERRARRLSSS